MKPIRTVSDWTKPQERTTDAEKLKKYEQQITNISKTQISEAIKFISY